MVLITGKGGVGKSTVCLALAKEAVAQDKKVLLILTKGQEFVATLYKKKSPIGYKEERLEKRLFAMTLTPRDSFHEYVLRQIKWDFLYRKIFESKVMRYFFDVIPGLNDLLFLGKIVDILENKKKRKAYDLIIVDLPATGHGLNMLRTPGTTKKMITSGPINRQVLLMDQVLRDEERTSIGIVTLPEEMPVNETFEMKKKLNNELHFPVNFLFINGVYPKRFEREEIFNLSSKNGNPLPKRLIQCARSQIYRRELQEKYIERLHKDKEEMKIFQLPFLFDAEFSLSSVEKLGKALGEEDH